MTRAGSADTRPRWRWSCALCPASGLADNRDGALSGWAWHYQQALPAEAPGDVVTWGNVPRVGSHDSYSRAILRTDRTGVLPTPPLPGPNRPLDFDYTEGASRLMPKTTYPAHVCTVLRVVSHTGGAA